MSDNIPNHCVDFKAAQGLSNSAKLLGGYMAATGITDAKIISDTLGIPLRTVQRLKLECATSATGGAANSAKCATGGVSDAPEAPNAPPVALSRENNHARVVDNYFPSAEVDRPVREDSPLSPPPQPKADRGSRLPADWSPDADLMAWTRTTFPQTTTASVARELDSFRDYWAAVPGQKGRKADWPATWRNWCRKSFATAPIRPMSQPPPSSARVERSKEFLAILRSTGAANVPS